MQNNYITLSELPMGGYGIISRLPCDDKLKKQLMNLGLICGTRIEAVCKSPSGNPCAYSFRGTLMAIRKSDTDKIIITDYGE